MRTRVGYPGGTRADPTYHRLGDHTETLQAEFDPTVTTYADLLEVFWSAHNPTARAWSRQYMSIIFYHTPEQQQIAEESKRRQEASRGRPIRTEIRPFERFYLAEEYHQKYYLRSVHELRDEYLAIYPDVEDLIDSTAVARVNGAVGGYLGLDRVEGILDDLGLSERGQRVLLQISRGLARR